MMKQKNLKKTSKRIEKLVNKLIDEVVDYADIESEMRMSTPDYEGLVEEVVSEFKARVGRATSKVYSVPLG